MKKKNESTISQMTDHQLEQVYGIMKSMNAFVYMGEWFWDDPWLKLVWKQKNGFCKKDILEIFYADDFCEIYDILYTRFKRKNPLAEIGL